MKKEVPLDLVHRLLAPRPAVLLTTHYRDRDNVMTAAWVCPVSKRPPLIVAAVHPARYTNDLLRRSEELVLNVAGRGLIEPVVACGTFSGAEVDKFSACGLSTENGHHVAAPWISECLAHLECAIVSVLEPGDHTLFIAQVLGAWVEEDAFDEVWRVSSSDEELLPLHHLGGEHFGLLGVALRQAPPR